MAVPPDPTPPGAAAVRGGALRVGGYVTGVALSVVAAALVLHHLGVERGGQYVTVLSLVTLAGGVTDAGLTALGVRELATRPEAERARLLRTLTGARIVLTVAGVAAAVVFALVAGYDAPLVAGTAIAGAGLLLQALQATYTVPLQATLRLGTVAALDLLRQATALLLVAALVVAGAGLVPFWAAGAAAAGVALVATAARVRGEVPLAPAFRPGAARALLRDVLPYAAATAVAAVYFRLAIVIVSLVAPGRETGFFAASFRVVEVVLVVPALVVASAFPLFARAAAAGDRDRLGRALGRTMDVCFVLGVGVAVVLALGAPFVIDVVAGPDFAPAAPVLRIQAAALAISFVGAVFGYALLSLRRHGAVLVVSLVGLITSGVLTTALTHADGARGAAFATAAAELVLAAASAVALRRARVGVQVGWRAVPRVLAAGAVAAALALTGLPSALQATGAAVVYAAAILALRAVPPDAVGALRRGR